MNPNHVAFLEAFIAYQEQMNKPRLIKHFKMAIDALVNLNTQEADQKLLEIAKSLGYIEDRE